MGKNSFSLSLKQPQKSTSQKLQSSKIILDSNLTKSIDWPILFFKFFFGKNPTNWDNIFFPLKIKFWSFEDPI